MDEPQDQNYKHDMEIWKVKTPARVSLFSAHVAIIGAFSKTTISSIILANSASSGAVLALIGALWGDDSLKTVLPQCITALSIFALGVGLAILTSGLAYLAQLAYAYGDLAQFDEEPYFKILQHTGRIVHVIAIIFGLSAILSFCGGAWYGIEALRSLK